MYLSKFNFDLHAVACNYETDEHGFFCKCL